MTPGDVAEWCLVGFLLLILAVCVFIFVWFVIDVFRGKA